MDCNQSGVDATVGQPDCDSTLTLAPIGSEALELNGSGFGTDQITKWNDDFVCSFGVCRLKTYWEITDSNSIPTDNAVIGFGDGNVDANVVSLKTRDSGLEYGLVCADSNSAQNISLTLATGYQACLEYDLETDDARFALDPVGGAWCAGTAGVITCDDTVTNRTVVQTLYMRGRGGVLDMVVDDFVVERSAVPATPSPTAIPTVTATPTPTPEPGGILQLISGVAGLAWLSKRRKRSAAGSKCATTRGKKVRIR